MTEPAEPERPDEPPGGRDAALREFTLSGFAEDERRALLEWPDRLALFAHLRSLEGPLRVPDLAAHIHALGFSAFPVSAGAFQATPMRHGETYVGGFFLGGREGGFTGADEETLVLFAQQAAAVAEPLTFASANSEEHSSTSCCRAQPLKLDRKPWVTASNPSCGSPGSCSARRPPIWLPRSCRPPLTG